MFLDCVIGRRGIAIQLFPSILANNIIFKPILSVAIWFNHDLWIVKTGGRADGSKLVPSFIKGSRKNNFTFLYGP
jgi:hypothetical protein